MESKNKPPLTKILLSLIVFFVFCVSALAQTPTNPAPDQTATPNLRLYQGGPTVFQADPPTGFVKGTMQPTFPCEGEYFDYYFRLTTEFGAQYSSGITHSSSTVGTRVYLNYYFWEYLWVTQESNPNCEDLAYIQQSNVGINDNSFTVTTFDFTWTPIADICEGSTSNIALSGLISGEDSFSGTGVSGTVFNPTGLADGDYTITAHGNFDNGSSETRQTTITILGITPVAFSNPPDFCQDGSDPNLNDWVDINGGVYSESSGIVLTGTNNRDVDLSASSAGNHTVTYTYTNANGCETTDQATVHIDASISITAGGDQEACDDAGNVALTGATSGVTWSCVSCSYVTGSNFDADAAPPGVYTVRASKTVGTCSDTDDKIFTVNGLPTVEAGPDLTECISTPNIVLGGQSPSTGGIFSGPGVSGTLMDIGTAGVGAHTVTYTYTDGNGCINADTRIITIEALPLSSGISTTPDARCGTGTVNLSASQAGNTIEWYAAATGGVSLQSGDNYSPSISTTTTYYVESISSNNCVSGSRKSIIGTVNDVPAEPISSDEERCGTGTLTFSASGGIASATYDWFENSTGGSAIHTGASFTSPSLSTSRSYYVEAVSPQGCISPTRAEVQATINSIPGLPSLFPDSNCGVGVVNLSVGGGPAGSTYNWYTSNTAPSPFLTSANHSPNISTTTSYWVTTVTAEGCEGARAEITGIIYPSPSAPSVGTDQICGPGVVNLSASGTNVANYDWYDTDVSNVSLSSSSSFSPNVTVSRSYWAEYTDNNGCVSPRTEVIVTVYPIPVNPNGTDGNNCGTGTVLLSANGSGAGASYLWYENITGGSSIHTGASFTTPSLSLSRFYYVEALSTDGCTSGGRTQVEAVINSIPGLPLVVDGENCGAGIVPLSVVGAPAGGDYRWYPVSTGGASFNSTNTYNANIATTESYWVSIVTAEGCEGAREQITATINDIPDDAGVVDNDRCGDGSVLLSANATESGTFNWYETDVSNLIISTGSNYNTPVLSATTGYWVEFIDTDGCVSDNRTEVTATIFPIPTEPVVSNVANCGSGQVSITASGGPAGSVYDWFDNPTGGSSLFTGPTYQPTVGTTRNYYVETTSIDGCISSSRSAVTVTINSIPSSPSIFPDASCGSGIVDLTVGGGPIGSTYNWYVSDTEPTAFTIGTTYSPNLSVTTSFWVSVVSQEGCEGARAEIIGTVHSVPLAPNGVAGNRCGSGTIDISASASVGGTFNWYSTNVSMASLSNQANFTTPGLSATTSYWVDITDANGCVSPRTEVIATVFDIPNDPTSSNQQRCSTGNVTMNASGSGAGAVYEWYASATGGSPIFIGADFTTSVSITTVFYVGAVSSDACESDNRTAVIATVNPLPSAPNVTNGSVCGSGIVNLSAGGAPAGGDYRWYPVSSGGASFNTASTYDANVAITTSFWVSIVTAEGCEGDRTEVVATVNDIPAPPIPSDGNRCGTGIVSLSVSAAEAGTFNWYQTEFSITIIFTGVNYTTPSISSTTSYWVEFTDSDGCVSATRTEVVATVFDIPSDPTSSPEQRCASGDITMSASGSGVGAVYQWYTSSTGGAPVHVGDDYTASVSTTTSFYVEALSTDGCISANRTQVVATVNPLPSAPNVTDGAVCGSGIVGLSAGGASAGDEYRWYTVASGGGSFNTLSTYDANVSTTTSFWVAIYTAEGCEGARAEVIATVNDIPSPPSAVHDDRCGEGIVSLSVSAVEPGTFHWYQTEFSSTIIFTGVNYTTTSISSTTSYWVEFTDSDGCVSATRTEVIATVYDIPSDPISSPEQRCDSGDVTMSASGSGVGAVYQWYISPTGGSPVFVGDDYTTNVSSTTNFYVEALSTDGCISDNRTQVIATVNALPSAPNVVSSSVCGSGVVNLSVSGAPAGGDYRWYDSSVGGSSLNNLSTYAPNISSTTSYWVSIVTAEGCEGARAEVVGTVNDIPAAPSAVHGDRCGEGIVGLSVGAVEPGTFFWYQTEFSSTIIFTGVNYTTTSISSTTSYWVEFTDSDGCLSATRTEVIATVFDIPNDPISSPEQRCASGDITMSASGSGAGAVYQWYTSSTGGSPVFVGDDYTANVSSTTSFYVEALSTDNCISDNRTQVVATVNALPSAPNVVSSSVCGSGVVNLSVSGAPAGGDYRWYDSSVGGISVNSLSTYAPNISITTSYWVSIVTAEGCEGSRAEVVGTVNDIPAAPSAVHGDRCGDGIVGLSVGAVEPGTFFWYQTEFSSTIIFTGVNYTTTSISSTASYWVEFTDSDGCLSATRTEVIATVFDIPNDPISSPEQRCASGDITMSASGSGAGAMYQWYTSSTGGSPVFVGDDYTANVSSTTSFYVEALSTDNCISDNRTQVVATVNALPSAPNVVSSSVCGSGVVNLSVSGAPAGGDYRWYDSSVGGISVNSLSTYAPDISSTTSYWVSIVTAEGCEGARAEVVGTVNDIPSEPTAINGDRCGSGTVALSVSAGEAGVFNWYQTEFSSTVVFTGVNYVTPSLSATTSYWVDFVDSDGCVSSTRTEVIATLFDIPADPISVGVGRCGTGLVIMDASGSGAGATYEWFATPTGGSALHIGESYTTSISFTTNFYVQGVSSDDCASDNRTQVIATVHSLPGFATVFDDEICGTGIANLLAGGAPAGGEYRWYDVATGGTSLTTANNYSPTVTTTTSYWVSVVTAEDCEGARAEVIATVNDIPLAPTGVPGSRCGSGIVSLSATAIETGVFTWYETEFSNTIIFGGVNFTTQSIIDDTSFWVEFTDTDGCVSPRTEVLATVYDIPVDPVSADQSRCDVGLITLSASGSGVGAIYQWYTSSVGGSAIHVGNDYTTNISFTTAFYVESVSLDGCTSSNRTQVVATLNSLPSAPSVSNGEVCGSGIVNLTVNGAPAGGSYNWYPTESGGMSFNSTNNYDADITATTSYWVSIVTAEGCEGGRNEVTATANDIPSAPFGTGASRCGLGSVTISSSAPEGGTFHWYTTEFSSTIVFTGSSYNTPSVSETTSFWAEFVDNDGCISPRTEVIATVFSTIPDAVAPSVSRCGPGSIALEASSIIQNATFEWYDNLFGGSPIFFGETFEPIISFTRNYYVLAVSPELCESDNRTQITATINDIPSAPLTTNGNVCGSGEITLIATGAPAGGDYNWYDTNSSSTVLSTGSNFLTPDLSIDQTYYVSIVNQFGCEGERSAVTAIVNGFPGVPVVSDSDRCGTGDIDLDASTSESGATIQWYLNASGGVAFATGTQITIDDLDETTTYYASVLSQEGCESGRVSMEAIINPIVNADIGENIIICVNADPYDLTADFVDVVLSNGVLAGNGVISGNFHPTIAGVSTHEITFFLTDDLGCLTDGSRFITVIDITEGGDEVSLSETDVSRCVNDGLLDLNDYPTLLGGTWTSNAPESALNVGILDPEVAGEGEYIATYTVDVNGCTVILEMDVNITASPEVPIVSGPELICIGSSADLSISNVSDATNIYHWYSGSETIEFTTGTTVTVTPETSTSYRVINENAFGCFSDETVVSIDVSDVQLEFTVISETIVAGGRAEFSTELEAESYLWDFGDGLTSTEQNPSHIYFVLGLYDVSLEAVTTDGCDVSLEKLAYITVEVDGETVTGIEDELSIGETTAYPQPFSDRFTLKLESSTRQEAEVNLYSITGNLIIAKKAILSTGENSLLFENLDVKLKAGIYLIRVIDESGRVYNHRVIKKN